MPSSGFKKSALRSEEHTSELQSHSHLVCRLLLGKEKDRKSTRLNSSHTLISYDVFCLKKKKKAALHEERQRLHESEAHHEDPVLQDQVAVFFFYGLGAPRDHHVSPKHGSSD